MERVGSRVTVSEEHEFRQYIKTARLADNKSRLLKREFSATLAASKICDDSRKPVALPNVSINGNEITMRTPYGYVSPVKTFLDRNLSGDWRRQTELVGSKLDILHKSLIDFDADPELPILYPIPAHLYMYVTDGVLWTLRELPAKTQATLRNTTKELREQQAVFIHGDLSLDNLLTATQDAVFIDWELAGMGSNLHDIGAIIASFLTSRVRAQISGGAALRKAPAAIMGEFKEFSDLLLGAYGFDPSIAKRNELLVNVVALKLLARTQVVAASSVPQRSLATILLRMTENLTNNSTSISEAMASSVG